MAASPLDRLDRKVAASVGANTEAATSPGGLLSGEAATAAPQNPAPIGVIGFVAKRKPDRSGNGEASDRPRKIVPKGSSAA